MQRKLGKFLSGHLILLCLMACTVGVNATINPPLTFATDEACETFGGPAFTTWFPAEVECPVCKTKNIFMEVGSYGSYIYQYPTKYQLIFWPHTDSPAWYSCKKCKLTLFMSHFAGIEKEKIPALQKMLAEIKLPPQKTRSDKDSLEHPPYLELPLAACVAAAEKVYRALDVTEDDFWAQFYRVLAYHYENDKQQPAADAARRKALAILEKQLADEANLGRRKELLYAAGAMQHYLGDNTAARRSFEIARGLTYSDKEASAENSQGYDKYLSKLITDYLEMLDKGESPRAKFKDGGS